jgi:NAD(P)-dependent dehydrogenase (short-subunit alcohol dehydrogenase family)
VQIIKKAGGDAFFVSVDLVKIAEIEVMVRTTVATFGKLNIFYTPTP